MSARVRVLSALGACVALAAVAWMATAGRPETAAAAIPFAAAPSTSHTDLQATAASARSHLRTTPGDGTAAVALADVLLRLARVETNAGHAIEAERVLKEALQEEPGHYTALKMLGAVYLSQHRFRDAVAAAERAQAVRPDDAWNFGVLGDAYMELGEYDRAFDALDAMARIRPDAAAYARVAYAHEVQGRLEEALATMRRAAEATSAHDPESLAWHYAQLGHLHLEMGDLMAAQREYARADFMFPGHPYARAGLARVAAARQDYPAALTAYRARLESGPTPEIAATIGDLLAVTGDPAGAARMYAQAEAMEREGWEEEEPQPAALAGLLAERSLKTAEAVMLAERAAAGRSDIFTMDALALAYYRAGRLDEAAAASAQALRTGTRNRQLLYHAAAIAHARGDDAEARRLLARSPQGQAASPLIAAGMTQLSRALGVRKQETTAHGRLLRGRAEETGNART